MGTLCPYLSLHPTSHSTLLTTVRICCALVGPEEDYKGSLHKIYANFPEMKWLIQRHQVTMVNLNVNLSDQRIDGYTREGLRNWLGDSGFLFHHQTSK